MNSQSLQFIFENQSGDITVSVGDSGDVWFVANDICQALGYKKPRNAVTQHVDFEDALKQGVLDSNGKTQQTTFINESGVYALIFGSKRPGAKALKRWVTSEVLPFAPKDWIVRSGEQSLPLMDYGRRVSCSDRAEAHHSVIQYHGAVSEQNLIRRVVRDLILIKVVLADCVDVIDDIRIP